MGDFRMILNILQLTHNILQLLGFSLVVGLIYLCSYLFLGTSLTRELYPLIVHLPLILFLVFHYKYRPLVATISVLTAYLCCHYASFSSGRLFHD